MKHLLSEEELQEMKDEIQNAKEEFDALQRTMARHRGTLARAVALCHKQIRRADLVNDADQYWQGRKAVAESVLAIITAPLKEGDS